MATWKLSTGTPPSFFPATKFLSGHVFNFYVVQTSAPSADWSSVGSIPTPGTGWFWSNGTTVAPFSGSNTENYVTTDA